MSTVCFGYVLLNLDGYLHQITNSELGNLSSREELRLRFASSARKDFETLENDLEHAVSHINIGFIIALYTGVVFMFTLRYG